MIKIPINQPGCHGMSLVVGFVAVAARSQEKKRMKNLIYLLVLQRWCWLLRLSWRPIPRTFSLILLKAPTFLEDPFDPFDPLDHLEHIILNKKSFWQWELYIESSHVFEYPSNMGKAGFGGLQFGMWNPSPGPRMLTVPLGSDPWSALQGKKRISF